MEIKKKLQNNVSNKKIDKIYSQGINAGSSGGKLLGAGAGGFILFYVKNENKKKFFKNMKNYKIINVKFHLEGSKIINI